MNWNFDQFLTNFCQFNAGNKCTGAKALSVKMEQIRNLTQKGV